MAASRIGKQLLDEAKEESLDEFLRELRSHVLSQENNILGIPKLDSILSILRYPPQPPRVPRWSSPIAGDIDEFESDDNISYERQQRIPPPRPPIVEITLPPVPTSILNSPSLQTALCIYLTALAVLPPRNETVVYISTSMASSGFSAMKLERQVISLLKARKASSGEEVSDNDIEDVAHEALSHVHVFRPNSTSQLLDTILSLPDYLADMRSHRSGNRSLGIVVVDSVDTFYWQDRMDDEIDRLDPTGRSGLPPSVVQLESTGEQARREDTSLGVSTHTSVLPERQQGEGHQHQTRKQMTFSIQTLLKSIQRDYSSVILFTTSSTIPSKSSLWSLFPTLRLRVSSLAPSVAPFAPHMSLKEALLDREKRKEVVQRGECVVTAVERHDEDWRSDIKEKFRSLGIDGLVWRLTMKRGVVISHDGDA